MNKIGKLLSLFAILFWHQIYSMKKRVSKYNCVVCGHENGAHQSVDHQCINKKELKDFLEASKLPNPQIGILVAEVKKFYTKLQSKIVAILKEDQQKVQQHLLSHHFGHLDLEKINVKAITKILNDDYSGIPHKRYISLIRKIKNNPCDEALLVETPEFTETKEQIQKFISSYEKGKTINLQEFRMHLMHGSVIDKIYPQLKPRKSVSDISNPEESSKEHIQKYEWKNSMLNLKSKSLQLSNKSISDQELLKEIPKFSSFKNVQEFEIRHNKLTVLSCRLIASNMKHIKVLDIRGNNVYDDGIARIAEGLPNLRSFMMSETKCSNVGAQAIIDNLPNLQMLWCENNQVDGFHGLKLAQKQKLKLLSLKGNPMSTEYIGQIKELFNRKGYINI